VLEGCRKVLRRLLVEVSAHDVDICILVQSPSAGLLLWVVGQVAALLEEVGALIRDDAVQVVVKKPVLLLSLKKSYISGSQGLRI